MAVPIGSEEWTTRSLLGALSLPARTELLGLGTEVRFDAGDTLLRKGWDDRHARSQPEKAERVLRWGVHRRY